MKRSLASIVNKTLEDMHNKGGTGKGSIGEQAVIKICEDYYMKHGGILYHSYTYKVDKQEEGNIKCDNGVDLRCENLGETTEIDVLLVTQYRIFVIEVKAYKAREIHLTDWNISGCYKVDKSPVHQNEMHCRHLYSQIFKNIPSGKPDYIVPVVVFVDKAKIVNEMSSTYRNYVYVTILNKLQEFIEKKDTPLEYRINLEQLSQTLIDNCSSCEKHFKLRTMKEYI